MSDINSSTDALDSLTAAGVSANIEYFTAQAEFHSLKAIEFARLAESEKSKLSKVAS